MHERRARIRGGDAERFDPSEVFERDGWRCYLCRVVTLPDADRYDPRKTTLDHVVPLAKGGSHTRQNTRCACRQCNVRKGARPSEVMTHARTSSEAE
ncbi:HNH endonuclease [Streptomyces sioyaensis]|uniref:HNH endonuclease n=1 Tax=Streptomyces sioyaensis TaxID=67364 RepID=UPI0037D7FD33